MKTIDLIKDLQIFAENQDLPPVILKEFAHNLIEALKEYERRIT